MAEIGRRPVVVLSRDAVIPRHRRALIAGLHNHHSKPFHRSRAGTRRGSGAAALGRNYFAFTIARYEMQPLAERVWQLRHRFAGFDARYLALAEALDASLVTCDHELDTEGHHARVRLIDGERR